MCFVHVWFQSCPLTSFLPDSSFFVFPQPAWLVPSELHCVPLAWKTPFVILHYLCYFSLTIVWICNLSRSTLTDFEIPSVRSDQGAVVTTSSLPGYRDEKDKRVRGKWASSRKKKWQRSNKRPRHREMKEEKLDDRKKNWQDEMKQNSPEKQISLYEPLIYFTQGW